MITKKDLRYFNIAKAVSKTSRVKRIHIGAVITINNNIFVSSNICKSHPLQKKLNKLRFDDDFFETCKNSLHAEMNCLLKIRHYNFDLSKAKLYVYRESNNNSFANSRPCEACIAQIKNMGIHHIFYTTDSGFCEEYLIY